MSRYIDADAVESTLQEMEMITAMSHIELGEEDDDIGEIKMPMFTVRNIMKTAPSIDLVCCRECKKAHLTYDGECKYCDEWKDDDGNYIEVYHDGNHYCSYGERKESE